jgi:hypothetical protein
VKSESRRPALDPRVTKALDAREVMNSGGVHVLLHMYTRKVETVKEESPFLKGILYSSHTGLEVSVA